MSTFTSSPSCDHLPDYCFILSVTGRGQDVEREENSAMFPLKHCLLRNTSPPPPSLSGGLWLSVWSVEWIDFLSKLQCPPTEHPPNYHLDNRPRFRATDGQQRAAWGFLQKEGLFVLKKNYKSINNSNEIRDPVKKGHVLHPLFPLWFWLGACWDIRKAAPVKKRLINSHKVRRPALGCQQSAGGAWLLKGICSTCQGLKEPSPDHLQWVQCEKEMLLSRRKGRHLLDELAQQQN